MSTDHPLRSGSGQQDPALARACRCVFKQHPERVVAMLLDEAMRVLNLERGPTVNLSLRKNEPHRPRFRGIVPVVRTDATERSVRFDHLLARTTTPRRSERKRSVMGQRW